MPSVQTTDRAVRYKRPKLVARVRQTNGQTVQNYTYNISYLVNVLKSPYRQTILQIMQNISYKRHVKRILHNTRTHVFMKSKL